MYNDMKITFPMYFKNFKCIGGECKYTCCMGWDIEVDKETFNYYSNIKDEDIKLKFQSNILKNEDYTSSDLDYGIIKLNDDKRCPFLDSKNYCTIYTSIGEEHLSNICTIYPRILNKVDKQYEISLDVSCIEAANLILSNKDGIKFETCERELTKYIINDEYNTNSKKLKYSPLKYLKEIRAYAIKIMQNREFDINNRLYILGDFLSGLERKSEYDSSIIPQCISEYNPNDIYFKNKEIKDNLFQIIFFKNVIESSNINQQEFNDDFKKCNEYILDCFKGKKTSEFMDCAKEYITAFDEYNEIVLENNDYIFENYIVNFMYNNLFPFSENDSMFDGYIMLIIRYCLIRFYLVGLYMNNKGKSKEDIIKFIMIFARSIEHDKNYISKLLDYIKINNYDNMNFVKKIL